MVSTVEAAIEVARVRPATMFVVGGLEPARPRPGCGACARTRPRAERARRPVRSRHLDQEEPLRAAGANVVLPTPVDPEIWDGRLDRLLRVPRRRSTRIPVRLTVWSRRSADPEPIEGVMLNVSANGMLLETSQPLPVGARFDLSFRLPRDLSEVHAIGRVVREVAEVDSPRFGVEFVVLRARRPRPHRRLREGRRRPRRSAQRGAGDERVRGRAPRLERARVRHPRLRPRLHPRPRPGGPHPASSTARPSETFGYRKAEVIGRPAAETIVPPRLRESHRLDSCIAGPA